MFLYLFFCLYTPFVPLRTARKLSEEGVQAVRSLFFGHGKSVFIPRHGFCHPNFAAESDEVPFPEAEDPQGDGPKNPAYLPPSRLNE